MRLVFVPGGRSGAALAGQALAGDTTGRPAAQAAPTSGQPASRYDADVFAYNCGSFGVAAEDWRQAAMAGDPRAKFRIGQLYEQGRGARQDLIHYLHRVVAANSLEKNHETPSGTSS
jgi:TPR repeat protein